MFAKSRLVLRLLDSCSECDYLSKHLHICEFETRCGTCFLTKDYLISDLTSYAISSSITGHSCRGSHLRGTRLSRILNPVKLVQLTDHWSIYIWNSPENQQIFFYICLVTMIDSNDSCEVIVSYWRWTKCWYRFQELWFKINSLLAYNSSTDEN